MRSDDYRRGGQKIFISGVTSAFKACRDALASDLRAVGAEVRVQEDFQLGPGTLLEKLEHYIAGCDRVIAVVGDAYGAEPAVAEAPTAGPRRSYSQWEVFFALGERLDGRSTARKPLYMYLASATFLATSTSVEDAAYLSLQRAFIAAMTASGQDRREFESVHELRALVLRDGLQSARSIESIRSRLAEALRPLPFPLAPDPENFVGRTWVVSRIELWLSDRDGSPVFWITGPPGVGKTAIAMHVWKQQTAVKAVHFCRYGESVTLDPRRFVMSIACQLSHHLPEYARRLDLLPFDSLIEQSSAETLFDALIVQPLWHGFPEPDTGTVILLDALDEATADGRNELAEFIGTQFGKAPRWLRLIITSRPESEVMVPLATFDPVELRADAPENIEDLQAYVTRRFAGTRAGSANESVIQDVVERSEGSFLYVHWICQELAAGRLSFDAPGQFPVGLGGVYRQYFGRRFPDLQIYRTQIRSALQAIAAAREPLPTAILAECLGWSAQSVNDFQTAVGSLFAERDGYVQAFHRSVTEWLTDRKQSGGYFVSEVDGHLLLAETGWKAFERGLADGYLRRHLPEHLVQTKAWSRLERLLASPDQLKVALAAGAVYEWMHYWRVLNGGEKAGERFSETVDALARAGTSHVDLAGLCDRLAWFLGEMSQFAAARQLAERGLRWREEQLGAQHLDVAASVFVLADICRRERDFAAAQELYERALSIRQSIPGADAAVAETLHGMGESFHDQKLYAAAQDCYERCLALQERALLIDDPVMGTCLNDLGALHYECGRHETALPLYSRAERIFRVAFGPRHPEFAATQFNKARVYSAQGQFARAWPLFLLALEAYERVYPVNNPNVDRCRQAFGEVMGQLDEASRAAASERLIEARERAYGFEHEITAQTIEALAWQYNTSNPSRAVERARRAVERRVAAHGEEHAATATALNTLVRCLQTARRFDEALPIARRALAIRQALSGIAPSEMATSFNNLGLVLVELGHPKHLDEAEPLLRRSAALHPELSNAHYWLGRLYERRGDRHERTLEAEEWQAFLARDTTYPDRQAHAKARLRVLSAQDAVSDS